MTVNVTIMTVLCRLYYRRLEHIITPSVHPNPFLSQPLPMYHDLQALSSITLGRKTLIPSTPSHPFLSWLTYSIYYYWSAIWLTTDFKKGVSFLKMNGMCDVAKWTHSFHWVMSRIIHMGFTGTSVRAGWPFIVMTLVLEAELRLCLHLTISCNFCCQNTKIALKRRV